MINRISSLLYRAGYTIGVILIGLMIVILMAAVVSRYVFNDPIFWTDELARIVLIWTIFVGAGLGFRKGTIIEHISIDILMARFSPRVRRVIKKIDLAIVLFFCVAALGIGWVFISRTHTIITTALEVSRAVIYSALIAFCIMAIVFVVERLVSDSGD